jgi:hypothetical protein
VNERQELVKVKEFAASGLDSHQALDSQMINGLLTIGRVVSWTRSQRASGGCARSPSPLKIETTEMAGHVHYLADEEQAWNLAALHRFG